MDQPTVTAANVLTGQKTTRTVHFAIIGDLELDCAAGIMAVLNQSGLYSTAIHRILTMLADRFAGPRKAEEEFERQRIQGDLLAQQGVLVGPKPEWPDENFKPPINP